MTLTTRICSISGALLVYLSLSLTAFGSCSSPANAIEQENCLPGSPQSDWDVTGAGDPTIQGFATDISVNVGQTVYFKINTAATAYTIDIYRMGYYSGKGARLVTSILPSATLPQAQPACLTDSSTGLVDCGNWAVSASWAVPATVVSGIYFAHLIRTDTGGDSHIVFIVRNDTSHSAILFQTADETWEAYNGYAGSSLYGPDDQFNLISRAFKVSYNRPFDTRGFADESATWVFGAEYPMVRFLEANGYDISYFTGIDAARNGTLILNHKIYVAAGHDEYWSGPHRVNVEQARDAGVNMAFFTGNEVFWKTRLEPSIDGTNAPNRTLVCYKETLGPSSNPPATAAVDPNDPPTWTGTWRDTSKSSTTDGGRPENSLTGTLFVVNGPGTDNNGSLSIKVPYSDGQMRFWRNTSVANLASGSSATLPKGTLGYEWDEDADNGSRPAGLIHLSTAGYSLTSDLLLDQGGTYGAGSATHHLTLYRAASGALVFGAGTVQWSWGLDANHDNPFFSPNAAANTAMRQATVNLFADMGVQPVSLQSGLVSATPSTDSVPPSSTITWPTNGTTVASGSTITVTGTASDSGGGVVGGIEVSSDGGTTWHPANGRGNWTYNWQPGSLGSYSLKSRAVDDSGNLETSSSTSSVVTVNPPDCPCSDWSSTTTPTLVDSGDPNGVELGVRFRSDFDGYITGIRFYKASANTGAHVGHLWTNSGTLLATATFSNETASGWQQVTFNNPVAISASTTYVASYFAPSGHYSDTVAYFAAAGFDAPPLHFLADGVDGANGVYSYSSTSTFPTSSYHSSNYWVDVVYLPASSMPGAPPALLLQPGSLQFTWRQTDISPLSQSVTVYNEGDGTLSWTASSDSAWLTASPNSGSTPASFAVSVNGSGLAAGTYTGTIKVSSAGATNPAQTVAVTLMVQDVLLSSTFDDGTMVGWVFSPLGSSAAWSVVNQTLQYSGAGNTQVYAGDSAWTDYDLDVSVKLSTLANWPGGIRARMNPSTGAGYAVWLYPMQGLLVLYRTSAWDINQGLVQLGTAPVSFDTVNFHDVNLSFQGSHIQVGYDGAAAITVTDATYSSGLVGLEGENQVITFDNVLVAASTPNSGALGLGSASLAFSTNYQTNPPAQSVQLSSNTGTLAWTASSTAPWLSLSPAYGNTPATLQVSVASAALTPGNYSGTVNLISLGTYPNTTQTITVNLSVVAPPPLLSLSPVSLNFMAVQGQSVAGQSIAVTNGGYGSFAWIVATDSSWLVASPTSGSTPQNVNVTINPAGLANGSYGGNVTISASGVSNAPHSVPVTLRVYSQDLSETFADQAVGWIVSPMGLADGWSVSNGVYSYSGLGLSQSCAGNAAWTDYTFDANIQLTTLSNWPGGVRARVNPSTGAGYAVWLYPGSGKAVLYRVPQWNINGPGLSELTEAPLSFDTAFHDLTMQFRGSLISVSWDGVPLMSATDATYASGFACLDPDSQPISYSNVRVAGMQSPVVLDSISPASMVFNGAPGSISSPQTISVTAGGANTTWAATANVAWLSLSQSSILTPGTLTISANGLGLAPGTYSGTITLSAPGASNSPISIPVALAVKSAVLSVSPSSLTFFGTASLNPTPQTIQVTNAGTGTLNWTANTANAWLGLSPSSSAAPSSITVTPNTTATGTGTFSDSVTITSSDAGNGPVTVPVSVKVGSLLFSDDFSSGTGSWTISPLGFGGGWSVVNGAYSYNGGGHTQSSAGSSTWTDYTVAVDVQLSSMTDYPGGLRGRVNTTTGASYGVWIYPAERILKLYRIGQWNIDADNTFLAQSGQLAMDTNWHNLRLVFQGTTIQGYYDNALVITASDSSYSQGAVALDVSNQPLSFDNVSVMSIP